MTDNKELKRLIKLVIKELEGDRFKLDFGLCDFVTEMYFVRDGIIDSCELNMLEEFIMNNEPKIMYNREGKISKEAYEAMYFFPKGEVGPRVNWLKNKLNQL